VLFALRNSELANFSAPQARITRRACLFAVDDVEVPLTDEHVSHSARGMSSA
jgi:hypothetical protein